MGLLSFFGDNSDSYNQLAGQLRGLTSNYQPWISAGKNSLTDILGQFQKLLQNPTFLQDSIAKNYQMSPYAVNQTNYLKQQLNDNAAATGNLGSSYAAQTLAGNLQDLVSRDENNYINTGINSYDRGLAGEEGLNAQGFNAENSATNLMAQADQANLQGQLSSSDALNNLLGTGLSLGANFITGGKGGMSTLVGGLGRGLFSNNWTNRFTDPTLSDALNTLRSSGLFGGNQPSGAPSNTPWQGIPYQYNGGQ